MIGVVVPAHNEEAHLRACIDAIHVAATCPGLRAEEVVVLVVLDDCTDRSQSIVERCDVACLTVAHRNVGAARAAGAEMLILRGCRWLAFTDADSVVSPTWLSEQLGLSADAVCGVVTVSDWSLHPREVRERYDAGYTSSEGHRHVHGANLGVSTAAYVLAGGFQPFAVHEDVALVAALDRSGARIAWSAKPKVHTSARLAARARGGFADHIQSLYQTESLA